MALASHGSSSPRRRQVPLLLSLATAGVSVAVVLHLQVVPSATELWQHRLRNACRGCSPGLCALLPAPLSRPLARTPSTSSDRWPQMAPSVSILPEPVERPLSRYLYKKDAYYDRVVPDWELQHQTAEQQYLYEGDFSLFVKELTDEGAVVQDITTGIFGWVPQAVFGSIGANMIPGDTIHGARCTHMDTTIVESPDPTLLRMQTGIVFEWDEANGEGYILPSAGQDAFQMIRVLRRDIRWHDSRRLFPGQFVQFETSLADEVPIEANDEPNAPFALQVRGLEVCFSLEEGYELLPAGASQAPLEDRVPLQLGSGADTSVESADEVTGAELARHEAFPVSPERPELAFQRQKKTHPLLQRFAEQQPAVAEAESPSWLWEPQLEYMKEERYDPIVPIQLRPARVRKPRERILTHEVAIERGDLWKEPALRKGRAEMRGIRPPGREQQEKMAVGMQSKRRHKAKEELRYQKRRVAALQKAEQLTLQEDI